MADDFEVDVSKWAEKAKKDQAEFVRALGENLVTELKTLTPVVTGNLRAGWHVGEADENHMDIDNGVVYARRVNDGFVGKDSLGRQYHQRGRHMVEQAIVETPEIARKTLEDLK